MVNCQQLFLFAVGLDGVELFYESQHLPGAFFHGDAHFYGSVHAFLSLLCKGEGTSTS